MRLTGLSKNGLITLISMQALLFVLPAIVFAFIFSVPILAGLYHFMVKNAAGYDVAPVPTGQASLLALMLGIFIPTVSSIVPIKCALSQNLNESINLQR